MCLFIYVFIYLHVYVYVYMYIYIYIYTYTHTHTHAPGGPIVRAEMVLGSQFVSEEGPIYVYIYIYIIYIYMYYMYYIIYYYIYYIIYYILYMYIYIYIYYSTKLITCYRRRQLGRSLCCDYTRPLLRSAVFELYAEVGVRGFV